MEISLSNQKVSVAIIVTVLGFVGVGLAFSSAKTKALDRILSREIFTNTEILEFDYEFGFIQESYWSGWLKHTPSSMKQKLDSGVWSVSEYFHKRNEYGRGNDFYQGIEAFRERYPNTHADELIFLTMQKDELSRGEVRCVTNEAMTESFVFAWGHF